MITRIDDAQAARLAPLFADRAAESIRISALLDAYGTGHAFFSTYLQGQKYAILSQLDDTFLLLDNGADYAELASFMQWSPHFSRLLGACPPLESVVALLPGGTMQRYVRMVAYTNPSSFPEPSVEIQCNPPLKDVYAAGGTSSSDFDVWYADMSHRIRHGCARSYLIRVDGEPVSSCLISAESRWAGLISGVFTKKSWRGRGFASALVHAASADLFRCKKLAVLECEFSLCRFYLNLGFLRDGEIGTYTYQTASVQHER